MVRLGIGIHGFDSSPEMQSSLKNVSTLVTTISQIKTIRAGETVGYGHKAKVKNDSVIAVAGIGYADGYLRGFSARGNAFAGEFTLPVLGRVSMDLVALGCDAATELKEGDWVELDYDLPTASEASGLTQYELLTTLGSRFERIWS